MGYDTTFTGELRFTTELSAEQIYTLTRMFEQDCREHPEWETKGLTYIDLEFNDDRTGLRWNGAEKTYCLEQLVNVVIKEMRKKWPDFGLTGTMMAQGEDISDKWELKIGEDGFAYKEPIPLTGKIITCPRCEYQFEYRAA